MIRCPWAEQNTMLQHYHDTEWGTPLHDDRLLFEMLALDGVQAGLSWFIVLKKRERFRKQFSHFDPPTVAAMNDTEIEQLLTDTHLIRNRRKLFAIRNNARAFLKVQDAYGSFDTFVWQFVDGTPIQNKYKTHAQLPARTEQSDRLSTELKRLGFSFVGSTICYAFMQAAGLVNDHLVDCFRHSELKSM